MDKIDFIIKEVFPVHGADFLNPIIQNKDFGNEISIDIIYKEENDKSNKSFNMPDCDCVIKSDLKNFICLYVFGNCDECIKNKRDLGNIYLIDYPNEDYSKNIEYTYQGNLISFDKIKTKDQVKPFENNKEYEEYFKKSKDELLKIKNIIDELLK